MKTDKPSPEHIAFAEGVVKILGPTIEKFGFVICRKEIKSQATSILYIKEKQYVLIEASTDYRDAPAYYNIVFGAGGDQDFSKGGWTIAALWRIKLLSEPNVKPETYTFPIGKDIKTSLDKAHKDLLKYGGTFLHGDLTIYNEALKLQNQG